MNFLLQFIAVCLIALVVCWLGDTHFRLPYGVRKEIAMRRYQFHNRVTCRMRGHKWDEVGSGTLGVCGRCYRPWPYICRHCKEPVHDSDDWVSAGNDHRCLLGGWQHHEV
jgi:hypothetical protein